MRKVIWSIIIVVLIGIGGSYIASGPSEQPGKPGNENKPARQVLQIEEFGFFIEYPGDPRQYTAVTPDDAHQGMRVFQRAFYEAQAYEAFANSTDGQKAPTAITVSTYRQPPNTDAEEWIRSQTEMSHFDQATSKEINTETIGGIDFTAYQYDDLYRTDAYVTAGNGYLYMVEAEYAKAESDKRAAARAMLRSFSLQEPALPAQAAHGDIHLTQPVPRATVTSPLTISGKARGTWFFEASFPIILTDWDGRIIAEGYAKAQGDWMTNQFVPFEAQLQFQTPEDAGGDFSRSGTLILRRANPSGLPENDAAIELPVRFTAPAEDGQ